jgi:hypothetical protein
MVQSAHGSRLALADTPNAVGLARLHTADVLSRWGVPSDVADTVKLLVSELTTNAVRHPKEGEEQPSLFSAASRVQTFEMFLQIVGDAAGADDGRPGEGPRVRLSVWDRDPRPPVLKKVGVEAVGGRGVFIVAMMSSDWGQYPARGMPGKVVWAEVSLSPEGRSSPDEALVQPVDRPSAASAGVPPAERIDPNVIGRVLVGVRSL